MNLQSMKKFQNQKQSFSNQCNMKLFQLLSHRDRIKMGQNLTHQLSVSEEQLSNQLNSKDREKEGLLKRLSKVKLEETSKLLIELSEETKCKKLETFKTADLKKCLKKINSIQIIKVLLKDSVTSSILVLKTITSIKL